MLESQQDLIRCGASVVCYHSPVTEIAQTRNWRNPLTPPHQGWGLSLRLLKARGRSRTRNETRPEHLTDQFPRLVRVREIRTGLAEKSAPRCTGPLLILLPARQGSRPFAKPCPCRVARVGRRDVCSARDNRKGKMIIVCSGVPAHIALN